MTVEEAVYYKYLLLCGYAGELEEYVDRALEEEDPLSNIILELSTCGSSHNRILEVLNSFNLSVPKEQIDQSRIFSLVLDFLRRLYKEENMPMDKLTELMYRISVQTEDAWEEPWHTMNIMGDLYNEAQIGFICMDSYTKVFNDFLNEGICLYPSPLQKPQ